MTKKRILLVATGGTIASKEEGNGLVACAFRRGTDEVRSRGGRPRHTRRETGHEHRFDQHAPERLAARRPHHNGKLRRLRRVRGAARHRHHAYTAAALSYLIQHSPKPIVLTGSQRPMASAFTDAKLNLYQSVLYATDDDARDVSIAFGGIVIAGTRARKQRTMSFNAFTSVNFPPLAYIRTDRIVRSAPFAHARKAEGPCGRTADRPVVYDKLDARVFALKLTPGLDSRIFSALAPSYDAVILETFGIGGIPEQGETRPVLPGRYLFMGRIRGASPS